jgi:hypothetical protein
MPHQAINLAENKLCILYYIHILGIPLTNAQVTQFFLENNLMNYFEFQQFLSELVATEHLNYLETGNKCFYGLAAKGLKTLNFFQQHIPQWLRKSIETYADKNRSRFKKENQIFTDYRRISSNEYEVTCKVMERNITLIELKLNVTSSKQAKIICNSWDTKAPEIYKSIIEHLITK